MQGKKVLIVGATSPIARATAIALAKQGNALYLVGRDLTELERIANDLTIRFHIEIHIGYCDIEAVNQHSHFLQQVIQQVGELHVVIFAVGDMSNDNQKVLMTNFTGPIIFMELCATYFLSQKNGTLVGISSVAGDRGRQSNYIYGAAKGGFSLYLQGLRNRCYKYGVHVITIKPGFIDTSMTFGMPGLFLVASPEKIGKAIVNALDHRKDVIYFPWFWRYIMWIIRSIPENIFKRLSL